MAAAHFAHGAREALREDGEFILFRSRYPGRAPKATVLLLAPVSARPSRESIQKLEHELSLKVDLDPEWAAVPLALVEHEDRPALLLDDAGGQPLHRLIHGPMEMGRFLHFAAGIARALRELHARNLIHKDLKPANVLVDAETSQGGVEHDLRRCLAAWEGRGRIDAFPLGEHDTPDRLVIPERLYGRSREVAALLAAFERVVSSGRPQLVLVSGYSGIGKSSVVNELHRVLVPPRGRSRRSACSRRSARGWPTRSPAS